MIYINWAEIIASVLVTIMWGEFRYHKGKAEGLDTLSESLKKLRDLAERKEEC